MARARLFERSFLPNYICPPHHMRDSSSQKLHFAGSKRWAFLWIPLYGTSPSPQSEAGSIPFDFPEVPQSMVMPSGLEAQRDCWVTEVTPLELISLCLVITIFNSWDFWSIFSITALWFLLYTVQRHHFREMSGHINMMMNGWMNEYTCTCAYTHTSIHKHTFYNLLH